MTQKEYDELQELFSKKIKKNPSNREEEYNNAILSCKSILKNFYKQKNQTNN